MEIVWKSEYELGIKSIDAQHQQLIIMINKLLKAHESPKNKNEVEQVFNGLISYCHYHFSMEEFLMKRKMYQDYDQHKEMHTHFFKKVHLLKLNHFNDRPTTLMNTINYLNDWLIEHIMVEDKKYKDQLIQISPTV
jgi:hemerythrin-like metal-binding protein